MVRITTPRRGIPRHGTLGVAIWALITFDAVATLFAGVIHFTGARIPLGIATLIEPPLLPAGIVETLAGLLFALAAYAVWRDATWAWTSALVANLFAILGFVVGIVATRNGTTPFNHSFHWVMLSVFIVGLILLITPTARASARE